MLKSTTPGKSHANPTDKCGVREVKESWYEKLERWSEALGVKLHHVNTTDVW